MRLKIFDVRALQHPIPLEIMSEALKMAHCGEILLMIHRREPFPLYDIIRVQGLIFKTYDFCVECAKNFTSDLAKNTLDSNNFRESLESLGDFRGDSKDFCVEFALLSENNKNDNALHFTSDFCLQNLAPKSHKQEIFFIFIAQKQILHKFKYDDFLKILCNFWEIPNTPIILRPQAILEI